MTTPDTPIARLRALAERWEAAAKQSEEELETPTTEAVTHEAGEAFDEWFDALMTAWPDLLAAVEAAKALDDGPAIGGRLAANLHDALDKLYRPAGGEEAGQ